MRSCVCVSHGLHRGSLFPGRPRGPGLVCRVGEVVFLVCLLPHGRDLVSRLLLSSCIRRGLSGRGSVLVIYGFTLITGLSGILLVCASARQAILLGAQVASLLGVLALFEVGSRSRDANA